MFPSIQNSNGLQLVGSIKPSDSGRIKDYMQVERYPEMHFKYSGWDPGYLNHEMLILSVRSSEPSPPTMTAEQREW